MLQQTQECYACSLDLTFTDENLLLGSKPHNRPLYVSGYAREQKIDRILIDRGSAVYTTKNDNETTWSYYGGIITQSFGHSRF